MQGVCGVPDLELSLGRLLEWVRAGRDVAEEVPGDGGRALLDEAAASLASEGRVVRVAAGAAALTLSAFMAQVASTAESEDGVLERGYERLAVPETPGGRVALLVSGAGRLQRPVLKFIQHVAKGASPPVLVMTGEPGWREVLDAPELAPLRARLAVEPSPPPTPMVRHVEVAERVWGGGRGWALAGLGVVAGVMAGVWLGQQRWPATEAVAEAPKAALQAAVGQPAQAAPVPGPEAPPPPPEAPAPAVVANAAPALPALRPAPEAPHRHHVEARRTHHAPIREAARSSGSVREDEVSSYNDAPTSGWGDPRLLPYYRRYASPGPGFGYRRWGYGWQGEDDE